MGQDLEYMASCCLSPAYRRAAAKIAHNKGNVFDEWVCSFQGTNPFTAQSKEQVKGFPSPSTCFLTYRGFFNPPTKNFQTIFCCRYGLGDGLKGTSFHCRDLLICKVTEIVQHEPTALLFRQLTDCPVKCVILHSLENSFLYGFLGLDSPPVQRLLGLVGLFVVPVYLIHKGEVIQFKAVKGIKQSLVDLHTLLNPVAVLKRQIEMWAGGVDTGSEYLVRVVLIFPAFGPGINVFG